MVTRTLEDMITRYSAKDRKVSSQSMWQAQVSRYGKYLDDAAALMLLQYVNSVYEPDVEFLVIPDSLQFSDVLERLMKTIRKTLPNPAQVPASKRHAIVCAALNRALEDVKQLVRLETDALTVPKATSGAPCKVIDLSASSEES